MPKEHRAARASCRARAAANLPSPVLHCSSPGSCSYSRRGDARSRGRDSGMRPRLAAALVTLALIAPALRAPAAGAVAPCAGVRVVVDFGHWNGAVEEHCVTNPASGLDALHQAGFATEPTRQFGDAYVCRIDGLPSRDDEACVVTPPANAYWAYYWARPGDASWHYSDTAATGRKPPAGSIDAWAFGDNALPRISPAAFPRVAPPATQPPTTQPRIVGPQGTAPPQPASIHPSPKVSNAAVPKTATTGAHTTVTTTPAST